MGVFFFLRLGLGLRLCGMQRLTIHHLYVGAIVDYQEVSLDIIETALQRIALGEAANEIKSAKELSSKATGDAAALIEVQTMAMMQAKQKVRGTRRRWWWLKGGEIIHPPIRVFNESVQNMSFL